MAGQGSKKPGTFKKGNSGFEMRRGTKSEKWHQKIPQLLRDIRWAYRHSSDNAKGTPQQEDFRELYKKDHAAFVALMTRQEELYKKELGKAGPAAKDEKAKLDEGSERAVEVLDRLLAECEGVE